MIIVTVNIEPNTPYRASEALADLRNAAESMYFPMTMAGFWDSRVDMHLCPDEQLRKDCTHRLPSGQLDTIAYSRSLERERQAMIQLEFPHAEIIIYLK